MELLAWLLPIVSGACDAGSRGVIKTTSVHGLTLVAAGYLLALPWYLAWLLLDGMPQVDPIFWLYIGVHVPLLVLAQVLMVEAHRRSPLILTMPYLGLTPCFLLGVSPLMGAGTPTLPGAAGVAAVFAGLWILQPIKSFWREPGSGLMVAVALIFAVTSNLDYLALRSSSSPFYLLVDHGLAGMATAGLAVGYVASGRISRAKISPVGAREPLIGYSALIAVSVIAHMLAFRWIPEVPYVIAVKRIGAIYFTVALGICLREREQLGRRLLAVAVVTAGMATVILWGSK